MSNSVGSNPYAVTTEAIAMPGLGGDNEAIRKRYLSHEASVKSIGTLYMLGAVIGGLASIMYVVGALAMLGRADQAPAAVGMMAASLIAIGITVLYVFVARGLWQLQSWARIVATVLSAIGLIGFPLGTLISAYFLYLLQSKKGSMVFSDEYKQIIKATPHIKYKTSVLVLVLLGLLVAVMLTGLVAFIASAR